MFYHRRLWLLMLVTGVALFLGGDLLLALGPAPYPTGPVEFENYKFEPGTIKPGLTEVYQFSWNGLDAARATLKITKDPKRPGWICARAEGQTIGAPGRLYRAQDWVESCMPADTLKPELYKIQIRESLDYYDMNVTYDHQTRNAHRTKQTRKEKVEFGFEFKNVYCPVSVALLVRSLPWKMGDERRFEVIDGHDRWLMIFKAVGEGQIKVPAGTFAGVRLQPSIFKLPGTRARENAGWWVKQQKKDKDRLKLMSAFEFWMAKDPPRPFLKARSDVYFGHVDFELKELKNGE
jgi:hypothetical protein